MIFDRPVGIDLGTTNSEIAMLEPSERDLVLYADRFGRRTVPSAVAWDPKTKGFLVGHAARARRGKEPPPVESIKRKMGQEAKVACGPEELSPEEVSSKVLGELAARMREFLGARAAEGVTLEVRRAVVTVPAYFDAPQVEATRRAGQLAGLDVIGVLQEPTAAAIYHTWKSRLGDGNFLVYDLGGGTFDVSVLRCVGGEYQVLAIDGDNFLGGDDFDRRFAEHLRKRLAEAGYALDLDVLRDAEDRARFGRLVHLAQEVKESLSTSDVVHVSKQDILEDKAGESVAFEAEIGRAEYEEITASLVDTTLACAERALARSREVAGVGLAEIDHVVLVGGSTRVPLVVRRVTEALCAKSRAERPLQDEVDTCVALGAAIHAAQLGGLGVRSDDGRAALTVTTPLVARGASLRLGLRVDAAPEGARELAVVSEEAGELARARLEGKPGEVLRLEVPLGEEPERPVRLAFRGGAGEELGFLALALYRGDVRPRASALSRPSVVAKDLAIEVVRAGRRERRVLVARGSGLPTEVFHRFFTADASGAVVLRLLQNRLPIKTLVVQVPAGTPVGTPVDLTLRCDEAMRVEARAVVLGQELWARVEAPSAPRFDPEGAIDALLEEAEQAGRHVWGNLEHGYRREAELLVAGIREVMQTDPDKLHALCVQLRQLIDEVKGEEGEKLSPPRARFESVLHALRLVVFRTTGPLVGMDRGAWEARIADLESRADEAHAASDATAWRRAFNEAQALYETASQEEFAGMRLDDPAYVARRLRTLVRVANDLEAELADFIPSAAEEVRTLQLAERDKLMAALKKGVVEPLSSFPSPEGPGADLHDARRRLESLAAETTRIRSALERLPALGLVSERGREG